MRAIVLFDGQNLFRAAKDAWGPYPPDPSSPYDWPSYDVELLTQHLVALVPDRQLVEIRFYTGVYSPAVDAPKHAFWTNKLDYLETQGVHVYRGRVNSSGQEKGVDVSLALDLVQATYEQRYETAIIVSQDADFGPAVFSGEEHCQSSGTAAALRERVSCRPRHAPWQAERGSRNSLGAYRPDRLRCLPRPSGLPASAPVRTSSVQFLPRPKYHQLRRVGAMFPSTVADRASHSAPLSM